MQHHADTKLPRRHHVPAGIQLLLCWWKKNHKSLQVRWATDWQLYCHEVQDQLLSTVIVPKPHIPSRNHMTSGHIHYMTYTFQLSRSTKLHKFSTHTHTKEKTFRGILCQPVSYNNHPWHSVVMLFPKTCFHLSTIFTLSFTEIRLISQALLIS